MVFISYSHDSPEHEAKVLALANRLREVIEAGGGVGVYALFLRKRGRATEAEKPEARFKVSGR